MAYFEKRGNSWRVQIRQKGGITLNKTFSKRVLAERWAKEQELAIEARPWTQDDPDAGLLCDRYLKDVIPLKPCGKTKKETIKFLSKRLSGVRFSEITPTWLLDYAKDRKVSPATLSQDVIFMGVVFEAAEVLWGMKVDLSAFSRGRKALAKHGLTAKSNERDRRVTDEEISLLLEHAETAFPMADLIAFAIDSTMRLSEQMNLRATDIDHDARTVLIRDRKHPRKKIGNDQIVPLLGRTYEIVRRSKTQQVFPYNGSSVSTAFHRAVVRAGIEDLRWHDLRHEGISRLFEAGYSIPEVALVSGHQSWEQLKRYTQIKAASLHKKKPALAG